MKSDSKSQYTAGAASASRASGPVLARWLGISGKAVYDLAKAGILVRVARDEFSLEESVRRYCEHIRQSQNADAPYDQGVDGANHRQAPSWYTAATPSGRP